MAVKASNQISVIDLTDAYSVVLTNEAYTFLGDTDSVSGTQSTTTKVQAIQGDTIVACTIGTITCPTGLSAVSDGKSPSPTITITATSALTSGGSIEIPVTIGDLTINKLFSYQIAFTGAKGATGATGKGISGTPVVTYQVGASGTSAPTGDWSSSPVSTTAQGQYLWTRTITSYTDGTSTTAYSVAAHGTTGATGATGATGNGVKSTAVTYRVGTSGTSAPTGTWSSSPVATTAAGQYLWTRTITTYTNGSSATAYSVAAHGAKGATGATGATGAKGADAITIIITSSAGFIFKNSDIATTLTAHVYRGGSEVTGTALSALGTVKWYKDSSTTSVGSGTTFTVAAGDVDSKASYTAQLEG